MVIGGVKHSTQTFNPRSAGVSSALLFVSVAGTERTSERSFIVNLNEFPRTCIQKEANGF